MLIFRIITSILFPLTKSKIAYIAASVTVIEKKPLSFKAFRNSVGLNI